MCLPKSHLIPESGTTVDYQIRITNCDIIFNNKKIELYRKELKMDNTTNKVANFPGFSYPFSGIGIFW